MNPRDRLRERMSRSSDRQIGLAALAMLGTVASIDVMLVLGAIWTSRTIMVRTSGATQIAGLVASAIVLCCALLAIWRITKGYRNLRRLIEDARKQG